MHFVENRNRNGKHRKIIAWIQQRQWQWQRQRQRQRRRQFFCTRTHASTHTYTNFVSKICKLPFGASDFQFLLLDAYCCSICMCMFALCFCCCCCCSGSSCCFYCCCCCCQMLTHDNNADNHDDDDDDVNTKKKPQNFFVERDFASGMQPFDSKLTK